MNWALLEHTSAVLLAVVREFQTLIAGMIALAAAAITARPVWRQLDRMSVQTETMYREFLADRLKALQARRKWLLGRLDPYKQEVAQRMYEMRELEEGLNTHWVFERAQITGSLIAKLQTYRIESRDPLPMAEAVDEVLVCLKKLEEALDHIHSPHSTEQSGEDWSFSDEEWAEISRQGDVADEALDGLVSEFESAAKRLDQVVGAEIDELRDRLKATDDALLKRKA